MSVFLVSFKFLDSCVPVVHGVMGFTSSGGGASPSSLILSSWLTGRLGKKISCFFLVSSLTALHTVRNKISTVYRILYYSL